MCKIVSSIIAKRSRIPLNSSRRQKEDTVQSIGNQLSAIIAHYEKKEYDLAEKAADQLLATHPEFPRAQFLKAVILEETGRAADAESYYQKSGNRYTLWLRLAAQLEAVDPERAITYYERVGKSDPANNILWFNLGTLYEKAGRTDKARECFRQLSPGREILSRVFIPLGFIIFLASGAMMMYQRGEKGLFGVVVASAVFCLFWLKRDAGKAVQMLLKKNQYR
jgi:tetratricopeptide (TPR) repeat protein